MSADDASAPRTHVVLVPGFAGFDALGQLQYYADVTPVFRAWGAGAGGRARPVLHYFDNLPTAGVATRAGRLRDWLARRLARGELQHGDRVALVGHSTGGLDVRRFLWDLVQHPGRKIPVDGAAGAAYTVRAQELLALVKRIVFLSVPQWGTNIADWVGAHTRARKAIVADLLRTVRATDLPVAQRLADPVAAWMAERAARCTRSNLFLAIRDALEESDASRAGDPSGLAAALEAHAELELWLRCIRSDFSAIDDLAVSPSEADAPGGQAQTPARFDAAARAREVQAWDAQGIVRRSFATVGTRPFRFEHGVRAPVWKVLNPFSWTEGDRRVEDAPDTDLAYQVCYRACAGGPFAIPGGGATAVARRFDTGALQELEVWDNDGIVNTASMLWPDGPETRLVPGDHGDIIGHFRLVDAVQPSPRRFHTYDLLGSSCPFDERMFGAVWNEVFDFCAG
jgi:hypothetical protein